MNFKDQREKFRSKAISAKEAVKEAMQKIKNDNLNIFINDFETQALKQEHKIFISKFWKNRKKLKL